MNESEEDQRNFENLLEFIKQNRGFDFTGYKRSSLVRRVKKQMALSEVQSYSVYQDYLEAHPAEFLKLFNTILINVTSFFRDPDTWQYLAEHIIPKIAEKSATEPIRIWSVGCASGQEAYTIAILLAEVLGHERFRQYVKIYATDVDEDALAQARQASFAKSDLETIPETLQTKYFVQVGNRYVFRVDLRRALIFGRHDLVQDSPISRLDLIICRNTLMYFNAETQKRIISRLHFALNDDGFLFLGRAEMLIAHETLFFPIEVKHRVFTKVPKVSQSADVAHFGNSTNAGQLASKMHLTEMAFAKAALAQIVIDANGFLVLANESARTLFGLVALDIGRPFHDLELSYRPVELRARIEQAYAERRTIMLMNIERFFADSSKQILNVQIMPLFDATEANIGVTISFDDVTTFSLLQQKLERSAQELETAYEELQSTNEELETTNEELHSTNEELETTNEELQSTNEELETINEELHSTNEELETINQELHRRGEELVRTNGILEIVYTNLQVGIIAVNRNLQIINWNKLSEDMWGLRSEEVLGKSLLNVEIGLPVNEFIQGVRNILDGLSAHETLTLPAQDRRGRKQLCDIVCNPIIEPDNALQGVVILIETTKPPET